MPIYQYACHDCSHTFDKLQKFSDDPLTVCPECSAHSLAKQIPTGTGFCLMGEGWWRPGMSASK